MRKYLFGGGIPFEDAPAWSANSMYKFNALESLGKRAANAGTLNLTDYLKNFSDFVSSNENWINSGITALDSIFPKKENQSDLSLGLDTAYSGISNFLSSSADPTLKTIGYALQANRLLGNATAGIRRATDSMTTIDSILESPFLVNSPISLVNSLAGKNTIKYIERDTDLVIGSYAGHQKNKDWAFDNSGKRYGLFSSSARRKANRKIKKIQELDDLLHDINEDTKQENDLYNSMKDYYLSLRNTQTSGYYTPIGIGLNGGRLDSLINKVKNRKKKTDVAINFTPIIIPRTVDLLLNYANNIRPEFWDRITKTGTSDLLEYVVDENGNAYVYNRIQLDNNGDLRDYADMAWLKAKSSNNYLKMLKEEAKLFLDNYKRGWPEFFNSPVEQGKMESEINMFKDGGKLSKEEEKPLEQKNVIPEGALHAHKHHMEHAEDLTKKGIPVVDNEGELLAEIEKEELVLTLEVTQKIEEFKAIFDSEESSLKQKDEVAIEAGKLLVDQILNNTDDRVNLIETLKENEAG